MDITGEQAEQYEKQLEDLSEKQILLELLIELKSIRYGLQTGQYSEDRNPNATVIDPNEDKYRCLQCSTVVKEENRTEHLTEQHNAPAMMDVEPEFSEL